MKIWSSLPDYVQIRKPQLIYRADRDGYALSTIYEQAKKYVEDEAIIDDLNQEINDSYHYCLFLVQTTKGKVFGAFISAFPH